jgi:AcrR family transcriptional regulator
MEQSKRKRGIETTRRIMETAASHFARRGYDSVPLREIAAQVGIKESSLYNHFTSKAQLLDSLFAHFAANSFALYPRGSELEALLLAAPPAEVFKQILFYTATHADALLVDTAMIINLEKFKLQPAADMYFMYVVEKPASYYEQVIQRLISLGRFRPVNARLFAEQYNYTMIALNKEYYMALNGFGEREALIGYMVKTIHFYCDLMKSDPQEPFEP